MMEEWNVGMIGTLKTEGDMDGQVRKNINRGYMKLTVWQDAKSLYVLTVKQFRDFSYDFKRIAVQQIASVDSVHRNIAEGYARRSINEYLQFLNIALGSLAESVSSLQVYRDAGQLTDIDFEHMDALAFKIENGLVRLIESLQKKREDGEWEDTFTLREMNAIYEVSSS